MPFGVKSHRDGLTWAEAHDAINLSPMPFGVKSHRDADFVKHFTGSLPSPMPFGVKSHRDEFIKYMKTKNKVGHQCLSA